MVPFHWFPKMEPVPAVTEVPSTWHMLVATHETEVRVDEVTPAGMATVASVQAVPFHVSAIGPEPDPPTARQNDGPTQETETRASPVLGRRVSARHHAPRLPVPHFGERPATGPAFCSPTATQNEALVHEMLFS